MREEFFVETMNGNFVLMKLKECAPDGTYAECFCLPWSLEAYQMLGQCGIILKTTFAILSLGSIGRNRLPYDRSLENPHFDYGLFLLSKELLAEDKNLSDYNLPPYINNWEPSEQQNSLINNQLNYDRAALRQQLYNNEKILNSDQKFAYDRILLRMAHKSYDAHFFLSGAGTNFRPLISQLHIINSSFLLC
jgi:hypothetical protein